MSLQFRIRLGRRVVLVRAEADSSARGLVCRGYLLEKVIHAALDVLHVVFERIGAALEVADALDLFEPVQEHLAENAGCPLAEPRTFNGLYTIAD